MINFYINPSYTITMVIHLMIQRHGYGKLADTLVVAALEGVVRGQDAKFLLNSLTAMGVHGRPHFNKLRSTVVSCRIFIRLQSLIAC